MAATTSEYITKCGSVFGASSNFKIKLNAIGAHYSTLTGFKTATVETLNNLRTIEGNPCFRALTSGEVAIIRSIQNSIETDKTIEENFTVMLTNAFVGKQLDMINSLTLEGLNANPLLCNVLNLASTQDFIEYYAFQAISRSIVTSMGYLIQNLLLYSNDNVFDGKAYTEGHKTKWDLVIEKIDSVRCFIEVKSGPNDLDAAQVKHYADEIRFIEEQGDKAYIGITYGKRGIATVTTSLFDLYLNDWENKTLLGSELWNYISDNESYHIQLSRTLRETASLLLHKKSITQAIKDRISELVNIFDSKYESIEDFYNSLW